MKRKFNLKPGKTTGKTKSCILILAGLLVLFSAIGGWCDPVALDRARLVAENTLRHHLSLYGTWEGSTAPTLADAETINYQNGKVAYNFPVLPSGHVLVAVNDLMTPVLLYSTSSSFSGERATNSRAVESWIVPELRNRIGKLPEGTSNVTVRSASGNTDRIARTWDYFTQEIDTTSLTRSAAAAETRSADPTPTPVDTVAPLLTTTWAQDSPYNLSTPDDECTSGHTLTGCVATAWSQVMNYWEWPAAGVGSNSYEWNGQTLEADFQTASYQWDLMPDRLTDSSSSSDEKSAVATLVYHAGIAANADFGCYDTGSSAWASDVLDVFFRYKKMALYDRQSYTTADWFNLIKTELDADRPLIFSIFTDTGAGHEVVIDGYQDFSDDTTDAVHINFGWDGSYDAWYAIADDIETGYEAGDTPLTWSSSMQYIVTGIEPNDNALPTVTIDADCDGMAVYEGTTGITLSGTAQAPTGATIAETQWRCVNDYSVTIADSDQLDATFTAPQVSEDTDFVFHLKAADSLGSVGFDQCTVTVRNTVMTPAPTPPSRSSGGGGGCFIADLF